MSPLTRREFMKSFGVGLASLVISACQPSARKTGTDPDPTETRMVTCYQPTPTRVPDTPTPTPRAPTPTLLTCYASPTPSPKPTDLTDLPRTTCYFAILITPTPVPLASLAPRDRLRACWLSFNELAAKTRAGSNQSGEIVDHDVFGAQLVAAHRSALDELVAAGEITPAVADLVQEAYAAAEYHVWRSNAPITCYEPMRVDYAPTSAAQLVQQSSILAEMALKGEIDPDTVARAQAAIQHDLAFEALSKDELYALYEKVLADSDRYKTPILSFDQVDLEITAEMEAAAKFLVELLGEK